MANTISTTTLIDGERNLVVLVNLSSDGVEGDETDTVLIDRSTFTPAGTETVVECIEGLCSGFTATLSFDATGDLDFAQLPDGDWFSYDWNPVGGVSSNKAGAGATGDILLTTSGFAASGDVGTFTLYMRKA